MHSDAPASGSISNPKYLQKHKRLPALGVQTFINKPPIKKACIAKMHPVRLKDQYQTWLYKKTFVYFALHLVLSTWHTGGTQMAWWSSHLTIWRSKCDDDHYVTIWCSFYDEVFTRHAPRLTSKSKWVGDPNQTMTIMWQYDDHFMTIWWSLYDKIMIIMW